MTTVNKTANDEV